MRAEEFAWASSDGFNALLMALLTASLETMLLRPVAALD
jgi:hypothetical protein